MDFAIGDDEAVFEIVQLNWFAKTIGDFGASLLGNNKSGGNVMPFGAFVMKHKVAIINASG